MKTRASQVAHQAWTYALETQSLAVSPVKRLQSSWTCQQCRTKTTLTRSINLKRPQDNKILQQTRRTFTGGIQTRTFSSALIRRQDTTQHELPSSQESRRSGASKRLSHMMDSMQTNIFFAGQRLNDLTGYSAIEALKNEIQKQEELVQMTRDRFRRAKESYTQAINQRSQSQREVNELLQRKHAWTPQDLERFTSLYRSDHANEQAEAEAQNAVTQAEHDSEEAAAKLNASILARYHEEQIWSDKIRRMSTWGTWGLMGVNVLLFLVFQIGVEPWRRKRLVKGFEDKVVEALEKETAAQKVIAAESVAAAARGSIPLQTSSTTPILDTELVNSAQSSDLEPSEQLLGPLRVAEETKAPRALDGRFTNLASHWTWRDNWRDAYKVPAATVSSLFSTQQIEARQVDLTIKFIEGALSSAVFISVITAVLRK